MLTSAICNVEITQWVKIISERSEHFFFHQSNYENVFQLGQDAQTVVWEIYCQDYYYMYLRNFKTLLFDIVKPIIYVKPKYVIGSKGNVYQFLEISPQKS